VRTRKTGPLRKAVTGLAAGAVVTAPLIGVFALGSVLGLPTVPFSIFEWLVRVLPGRLVIFGLEQTLRLLEGLGFNIKNTAKTTEEVLALTGLFVLGWVVGLLFFSLVRSTDHLRVKRYGRAVGGLVGLFSLVIVFIETPPAGITGDIGTIAWVLVLFLTWGWALTRLYLVLLAPGVAASGAASVKALANQTGAPAPGGLPAPPSIVEAPATGIEAPAPGGLPAPARAAAPASSAAVLPQHPPPEVVRIGRRRFLIEIGGLVATIVVLGSELADVLRVEGGPAPVGTVKAPIPFPNADSPVKPVPGTRPEYTPVADHYRVDIDLSPPQIDAASWRLNIRGLVANPLTLTLDQLKMSYRSTDQFITLSCISNPVGGPLTGTTLWSGPPFRDVLATAAPTAQARYAHLLSEDGFDEVVDLAMIQADPRVVLAYNWNGQPLPTAHGFPLRVYVPDVYGMKQPKWITDVVLVADNIPGYWVTRGWDPKAEMRTTSVVDTVATAALVMRGGKMFVPIGGIAHAGDRGISKVEVQVDSGVWEPAELRAPLSDLTWVIWRYEWPFKVGDHVFSVRAYDGQGKLQITAGNPSFPSGATGVDSLSAPVLPVKL
jgi:DMSO/TMAO reductase YedYZ molybdopterin-dependent catalytic subunit